MQYLGSEVGQFGGLFKADDLDATRVGTNPRVGSLHAVDIGPDLDALGVQSRAHQRRGKIGAAAPNRRGLAFAG